MALFSTDFQSSEVQHTVIPMRRSTKHPPVSDNTETPKGSYIYGLFTYNDIWASLSYLFVCLFFSVLETEPSNLYILLKSLKTKLFPPHNPISFIFYFISILRQYLKLPSLLSTQPAAMPMLNL